MEPIEVNRITLFIDRLSQRAHHGIYGERTKAAKADTIANATKKAITERMEKDPAFYEKFSRLIQQAIDDFRAKRISDLEYLNAVTDIRDQVKSGKHEDMPEGIADNENAQAFYGILKPFFEETPMCEEASANTALAILEIMHRHWKVQFWDDDNAQKRVMNDIDDYLYDEVKGNGGIDLSTEQMDEIIERAMQLAKHRGPA